MFTRLLILSLFCTIKNCDGNDEVSTLIAVETNSSNGHSEIDTFDQRRAEINAGDGRGRTPLHLAVENRHLDVVENLVVNKADVNSLDDRGYSPLHLAASKGYLEIVDYLVNHGAKVNATTHKGYTPLHVAGMNEQDEVVKYLLKNDTNVSVEPPPSAILEVVKKERVNGLAYLLEWGAKLTEEGGRLSLLLATSKGRIDIVKHLVEKGVDVNAGLSGGRKPHLEIAENGTEFKPKLFNVWSPLHFAASRGYLKIVKVLIESGAEVDVKDTKQGETPLLVAIRKILFIKDKNIAFDRAVCEDSKSCTSDLDHPDYLGTAHYLLDKGADMNVMDKYGGNVLVEKVIARDFVAVRFLVELGANVNVKLDNGYTALHFSSYNNDLEMTKFLIERGAEVNSCTSGGRTPLHLSVERVPQSLLIVKHLIEHGADVNATDQSGYTPLHKAVSIEIVEYLLEKGANVNAKTDVSKNTPLHGTVDFTIAMCLVEHGADVNAKNVRGLTPLHYVLANELNNNKNYTWDLVKLFLDYGADVDAVDLEGNTPLCYAVDDALEVFDYLLEKATNVSVDLALYWAVGKGAYSVAAALLNRGADVNHRDFIDGNTLLHLAVLKEDYNITELLINRGADMKIRNDKGFVPLHLAAGSNNLAIVKCLVERGADVNIRSKSDETPLHLAASLGYNAIVEYLVTHGADAAAEDNDGATPLKLAQVRGYDTTVYSILSAVANAQET